jgi:hypothetical protein
MSYLYINLLILLHQVIKLLHLIFTHSQYNIATGNFEYEFIDKPILNSVNQQVVDNKVDGKIDGKVDNKVDSKVDGKIDDDDYVLL